MGRRNSLITAALALSLLLATGILHAEDDSETSKKGIGDSISSGVNVLNKVGGGLLNKMGGVASKVANRGDIKPPSSIAVLPAGGEGTAEEQSEIRIALHNSLGSTNIRSLKPAEVDRLLVVAEQTLGQPWAELSHQQLASVMAVDGLLLVDVEKIDRLYAGAYAHYEVGVKVSLYTADANDIVWDKSETEAERKGGVSINPLGMIATAVSSARILSDAVRQVLVNTLARRVAAEIPQPSSFLKTKKPIIVDMAVSNGVEGPFSVGDEITVLAKAEPGLVMFFDVSGLAENIALDEKAEGEYIGSYVVSQGENADNLYIALNATRVDDKQTLVWRVPGKLSVDTTPPGDVTDFQARSTSDGVALSWQPPQGEDLAGLSYMLERAHISDGVYQTIADVAITEYQDTTAAVGASYYYRIRSLDEAKNEGSSISRKVSVFKPGPTDIGGLLEGQINFPAIGNPYRLSDDLLIASGAEISFDEGTILELAPKQKITVQGTLVFNGSDTAQITIRGDGWRMLYDGAGAAGSVISNTRLSGLNAGITVAGSTLAVVNTISDGVSLQLEQYGMVNVQSSQMLNAQPALRLVTGEATLNSVEFLNNEQAIVSADAAGQSSLLMQKVRFERNKVALSVASAYTLGNVAFPDASLSDIQAQLDGPISLDWSTIAGGKELIRSWLAPNILALKQAFQRKNWQQAERQMQKIAQVLPSEGIERLQYGLQQANEGFANVSYGANQGIGSLLAEGNRILWIQNETLPSAQAKSEELSTRAMLKKFGKSYVKELFPNKNGGELAKAIRGIDLSEAVDASQYLYSVDKGLLSEVWMVHVINQAVLDGTLAAAGLGSAKGSRNVYAVSIDNAAASNIVLDLLEGRGIRYKVSRSGKGSPYRLTANVVVSDSASQISKNLKVAEATIRFRLEETRTAKTLGSWKAVGSASAFGKSEAHKQALQSAITKVENAMVKAIWAVDAKPVAKAATPKPAVTTPAPQPKAAAKFVPTPEPTPSQTAPVIAETLADAPPAPALSAPAEPQERMTEPKPQTVDMPPVTPTSAVESVAEPKPVVAVPVVDSSPAPSDGDEVNEVAKLVDTDTDTDTDNDVAQAEPESVIGDTGDDPVAKAVGSEALADELPAATDQSDTAPVEQLSEASATGSI